VLELHLVGMWGLIMACMWPLSLCYGLQVMEMFLWVCYIVSRRSKSGNVFIYML